MTDDDIERIIEIEDDRVHIETGGTSLTLTGVLSKRHAQILAVLVLAMLGYNYEQLTGLL